MLTLLGALLLVPFAGAFLSTPTRGRDSDTLAILTSSSTVVLALAAVLVRSPVRLDLPLYDISWLPEAGHLFGFFLDPLSSLMVIIISVIGFLVILYSTAYVSPGNRDHATSDGKGRYFLWMFLFVGSMLGLVVSPNFLQMFIFWELTSVCSWALISFYGGEKPLAAGFKALLLTNLGGVAFMVALMILYVSTHSFAFEAVLRLNPHAKAAVFLLFLLAAWAKAAQIPFYTWLPDAMEAPTPVSAYLHAAAMVKAGVYLIARIVITPAGLPWWIGLVVAGPAVLTMVIACLLFFFQDDLKRLLAYSTITHLSYILLGAGLGILGSATGMIGGILHFFFLFWALMTLASYALVVFERQNQENWRAGFKYFLMTHVATACMFLAGILLYVRGGSFSFDVLRSTMGLLLQENPGLAHLVLALFFVGFFPPRTSPSPEVGSSPSSGPCPSLWAASRRCIRGTASGSWPSTPWARSGRSCSPSAWGSCFAGSTQPSAPSR